MNQLEDTLALLRRRKRTNWCSVQTMDFWLQAVRDEAQELIDAQDYADFNEEAGDVLANLLTAIMHAEERSMGHVSLDTVMIGMRNKLRRRKPWLFDATLPVPSAEEEHEIWLRAKMKERSG